MNFLSDNSLARLRHVASEPDLSETKYTLLRDIGHGGMAAVFLVHDRELDRDVALKVLDLPDSGGKLATRMMREAKVVARLEHPGIVPIHDVGTLPDGRVFYTMKHVKGETLVPFTERALPERLRVFEKICEAVAFAHSQNVIHRDLKPENIMVGSFGEVLVMDWGLAKVLRDREQKEIDVALESGKQADSQRTGKNDPFDTEHGNVMGTPSYMAPEQAAGEVQKLDQRTDVYSLGAILYFLITRNVPQEAPGSEVIPPRKRNRSIARSLEAICLKALAKKQEDRYADAQELRKDIVRYMDGLSVSAYRENVFEIVWRWTSRNYFFILLILSYLFMRILLLLFF